MKDCIFCAALNVATDRDAYILLRGEHNFVILNKFPYTPGHLMIAPLKHLDSPEKASEAAAGEMMRMLTQCLNALKSAYNPQGFNVGMNIGHCAGAGVADHFHQHVIPRWTGDANFMPLIGETRVFIEDLHTTYDQLLPLFRAKTSTG